MSTTITAKHVVYKTIIAEQFLKKTNVIVEMTKGRYKHRIVERMVVDNIVTLSS